MTDAILSINAGSSSIKLALFALQDGGPDRVLSGEVDGIGEQPRFVAQDADGRVQARRRWDASATHEVLLGDVLDWTTDHLGGDRLVAAGHRIVHGGSDFTAPVRLTKDRLQALQALTPLAPLHQPHCLAPVQAIRSLRPELPQVACFDTAFHHTMPALARRFALPPALEAEGVRRYGFHGLSYEFIAGRLRETSPSIASGRVVVAHLGNGASLCAMLDGRSLDTTMGFTALDGLVMGTRCGALDPGVVLYLLQQKRMSADAVADLLYHRSGLLGVSGISSDMGELLSSEAPAARNAIELFVARITRETAAMASALEGLDGLVFTGGIGTHAAAIREAVCRRLGWLGVEIDAAANAGGAARISRDGARVDVRVIATDEELMIARHAIETLQGRTGDDQWTS